MIRVTIWNEFVHEKTEQRVADIYPNGIHGCIAEFLGKEEDFEIRTATLDMEEHGLTEEVLFERLRKGYLEGYTKNYTPVHVISDDHSLCGEVCKVRLVSVGDDCCMGELV